MRSRIIAFIIFQLVAWTFCFRWESSTNSRNEVDKTFQKLPNVVEIQNVPDKESQEIEMTRLNNIYY